jgi:hypothetical protein
MITRDQDGQEDTVRRANALSKALLREGRALELHLQGKNYDEIAADPKLGYKHRANALKAVRAALSRVHAADADTLRMTVGAQLKENAAAARERLADPNLETAEFVALQRSHLRVLKQISDLWGLSHSDGIDARRVKLDEQRAAVMAAVVVRALEMSNPQMPDEERRLIARQALEMVAGQRKQEQAGQDEAGVVDGEVVEDVPAAPDSSAL